MDATYSWQCQQVGMPVHPGLLRSFSQFERKGGESRAGSSGAAALLIGGDLEFGRDPPVRDADVVATCLVMRSLSRTGALPAIVRLDLTGQLVTSEGAQTIAAVLQVSCGLCSLLLRRTHVSDDGAAALGAALSSSSLVELDLGEAGITNAGMRFFARGATMHGMPSCFSALFLDSNLVTDDGLVELISLLESPCRPPSLRLLSAQPSASAPQQLSSEVQVALKVTCELAGISLRPCGEPLPVLQLASRLTPTLGQVKSARPVSTRGRWSPAATSPLTPAHQALQLQVQEAPAAGSFGASSRTNSAHLASWMASTERELRELKWLLSSTSARLDGQHDKLMGELDKVRSQLDSWTSHSGGASGAGGEQARLEVLEARFDALEQLVGREQSECAQMWQLVEVAAGAGVGATGASAASARTPPPGRLPPQ